MTSTQYLRLCATMLLSTRFLTVLRVLSRHCVLRALYRNHLNH